MKENEKKFLNFLEELSSNYSDSLSNISKTGENNSFIVNEKEMISLDDVAKDYAKENLIEELSSVDGLYYKIKDDKLIIYLFEFKKMDFFTKQLAKERLKILIEKIESGSLNENCEYEIISELKEIKNEVYNKLPIQLKNKPIESLLLLHNLYENKNGEHKDIVDIEKHYYVVSETSSEFAPFTKNKSKNRKKGKSKEIFDFLDKIHPFPFKQTKGINYKSFFELILE